jgi:hypothetical protein
MASDGLGAGKTSLLNVLAGRFELPEVDYSMSLNGEKVKV